MKEMNISFIETEKQTWIEHLLCFNEKIRTVDLKLDKIFKDGDEIELCYINRCYKELEFEHWFIRNKEFFFEFGSLQEDIYSSTVYINTIDRKEYRIKSTKVMNEEIRTRMNHVLGMKNYSLCFRNSEHVANYIFLGKWLSFQMLLNASLFEISKKYMSTNQIQLINSCPETIRLHKFTNDSEKVYNFIERKFKATNFEYHLALFEDTYNILVIGHNGSGKSILLNLLFNQKICDSNINEICKNIIINRFYKRTRNDRK